jgi:phosphoribosylglycinamide formyltransferase-1
VSESSETSCPVVVLISGNGSNLQAIIDSRFAAEPAIDIRAVISNKPDAHGLDRADEAGIPCFVINHRDYADRATFDAALIEQIDAHNPRLIILAGFMRILTARFVAHYSGRLINIHPSLLPHYPGLHTHAEAIKNGDREAGATVHFVTQEVDGGPIVIQARIPVLSDDTADTRATRVLKQEHVIYPRAIRWFAENRLKIEGNKVLLDNTQSSSQELISHEH